MTAIMCTCIVFALYGNFTFFSEIYFWSICLWEILFLQVISIVSASHINVSVSAKKLLKQWLLFIKQINDILSFFSFYWCTGGVYIGYCIVPIINLMREGECEWLSMWYTFKTSPFILIPLYFRSFPCIFLFRSI